MSPPRTYLGQWALLWAIRAYQRWLSGRGPLRRVVCTFAGVSAPEPFAGESCSRYGLRIAQSADSLGAALRLIRQRLRRCSGACLYRHPEGLLYGPLYDGLAQSDDASAAGDIVLARLVADLMAAREQPAAVALVLRSAAVVARSCGQTLRSARCVALARRLCAAPSRLPVRDGRRLEAALSGRLRRRLWVAVLPLSFAAVSFLQRTSSDRGAQAGGALAALGGIIALLVALVFAARALAEHQRECARLRRLRSARRFALAFAIPPERHQQAALAGADGELPLGHHALVGASLQVDQERPPLADAPIEGRQPPHV